METFNAVKQFEPSHLALDSEKIGLLLASHDAHLLVTSYDGVSLWDDASGEYQIRLYIDLEQVAICDADEHEGIGNLQLHPAFSSHRELITQIFSSYLDAPEFLFEISEFHAVSLNALSELRAGQYSIQTINGEQLLTLEGGRDIAQMFFSEGSQSVSFTSELLINSPIYSHKLASEILNVFSENTKGFTEQVKKDLIEKLEKLNEDLRYNCVPRSKLLTLDPLFVTSPLTKEVVEVEQKHLKVAKIVANETPSEGLKRDTDYSPTNTPKLTLVRGIPGSGKTTFANTLSATVVVEADQYFIDKDGAYQYDNHRIKEAHNWCQLETKRLLKAGHNVAVANTFVKNWEMKFYKSLADDMELAFEVVEMKGSYQNVHGVPDAIVKRMASQFESLEVSLSAVRG